ncbi:MAG: hypothetical protein KDD45_12350, partial [Bdellovibrionales bacterium]|nr:hypothetical protein [Bdellovibrionales bacterium]
MMSSNKENTKKNHTESEDSSDNGVWYSLALHFFILSVIILKNVFWAGEEINYESAIRVDLVALPDKITKEMKMPSPQIEKKEEKAPPNPEKKEETVVKLPDKNPQKDLEAINLEKKKPKKDNAKVLKQKQDDALDKVKRLSAIDKIKSELEDETIQQQVSEAKEHQY